MKTKSKNFWDSNRNPITWHKIDSAYEKAYIANNNTSGDYDTCRDSVVYWNDNAIN